MSLTNLNLFLEKENQKKIMDALIKKAGGTGVVSEDMLIECVKEITPKPFVIMALSAIEPLRTP